MTKNTSTSNMTDHEQHQRCEETTTPLMQWTEHNTNTNNAINQHQQYDTLASTLTT